MFPPELLKIDAILLAFTMENYSHKEEIYQSDKCEHYDILPY